MPVSEVILVIKITPDSGRLAQYASCDSNRFTVVILIIKISPDSVTSLKAT